MGLKKGTLKNNLKLPTGPTSPNSIVGARD